jgi:hypothetical protein
MTKYATAAFALLLSTTASAGIYFGHTGIILTVERPQADFHEAVAQVDKVRIHHCGRAGYDDYEVKDMVDFTEGLELTISGGDLCSAEVFWDSDLVVTGSGFTVQADPASSAVPFAPEADAAITPWAVTMGAMPSPTSGPRLHLTIQ